MSSPRNDAQVLPFHSINHILYLNTSSEKEISDLSVFYFRKEVPRCYVDEI